MSEEEIYELKRVYDTGFVKGKNESLNELIKYIEDRIEFISNIENPNNIVIGRRDELKDLLERIRGGNYE